MKRLERTDLALTAALGALFLAGCFVWAVAWMRERDALIDTAQDQLEQIALRMQDDARCVELFADRTLPGGSEFYLIAPPGSDEEAADTIARYRVHTAGPDTILQRTRFPIEFSANMQVHVRLNFLLPLDVDDPAVGTGDVFADRSMLCAVVEGRRMELVDTALLSHSVSEVLAGPAYAGSLAVIVDTLTWDTLYRSAAMRRAHASVPTVRTASIVQPGLAPWVLQLALPSAGRAALRDTLPYLVVFLALFGALVFTLWRSRRAWAQQQHFAAMQLDLVGNITHEFNTPLAHISLALDALRRSDRVSGDRHLLDIISQQNERMQANVKKVMAVSVLDHDGLPLELELHDVHELLGSTLRSLAPTLEKEAVKLDLSFAATDPWVLMDATYLTDVLHAVLDNAIKYARTPKQVCLSTTNGAGRLIIRIADNGPGVPVDERELAFDKFYRGTNGRDPAVKGTGIGLYFARKVLHAHQGTIHLGDGPLGGALVEIVLPQEDHG